MTDSPSADDAPDAGDSFDDGETIDVEAVDAAEDVDADSLSASESAALERVRTVANAMDQAVEIPGTNTAIGLDSIVGLFPVSGDLITGAVSLYIVAEAARLGISRGTLLKMLANVAVDVGVGSIPVLGDIFDVFFKSNQRNADLLERALTGN